MKKIVINKCYGGFSLSNEAYKMLRELGHTHFVIPRDATTLVRVVEELGEKANGSYSDLKIVEIPEDVEWYIEEYDGIEWVAEKHRTWGK